MDNRIVYGKYSIILGNGIFSHLFKKKIIKKNVLMKVTYLNNKVNNETKYNYIIKNIKNYYKYFSLVDSVKNYINPNTELYFLIKNLKLKHDLISNNYPICYYFIPNDGDIDLYDNLYDLQHNYNIKNIWIDNTLLKFKLFIKHLSLGISFLHQNKICHFDIKPENIIINLTNFNNIKVFHLKFKIIDFGFAEKEPFHNYLKYCCGTPGFSTRTYKTTYYDKYIPFIKTNDWNKKHISIFHPLDEKYSIYKTDIYSLGITYHSMFILFNEIGLFNSNFCCLPKKKNNFNKIIILIDKMIKPKIQDRINIKQCLKLIKKFNY